MAILKAGADGKAPPGAKPGDLIQTNGGDYLITGLDPQGGFISQRQTAGYADLAARAGQQTKTKMNYGPPEGAGKVLGVVQGDGTVSRTPVGVKGPAASAAAGAAGGAAGTGDDFWGGLIDRTENRYQQIAKGLRGGIDAQTQRTLANYDAQKADLGQRYQDLNRQLYIDRKKDEKRLPQQLAAQGLTGGMSESAALQLANAYNLGLTQNAREQARQEAEIDRAMADARLQGEIAASQSDAEISQAALGAYQVLMQAMRGEQMTREQQAEDRRRWEAELELSQRDFDEAKRRWETELARADQRTYTALAESARADLAEKAETLAAFGDFSGYSALGYSQAEIDQMKRYYAAMLRDNESYAQASSLGADVPLSAAYAPTAQTGDGAYRSLTSDQNGSGISYAQMDAIRDSFGARGLREANVIAQLQALGVPAWQISDWAASRGIDINDSRVMSTVARG